MSHAKLIVLLAVLSSRVEAQCDFGFNNGSEGLFKLPPNFLFGAGSSAPQTEGAWNADGKGESEWDHYFHEYPNRVVDHSNSDVACDSYHLWENDVDALEQIGLNAYRFSISWSRLLPTGEPNNVNEVAVNNYNALLDELLQKNITPVVTLYEFDMPLNITKLGGWTNKLSVDYFRQYAVFAFMTFGQKVKYWVTFNEPGSICTYGYGIGAVPPGISVSGIADYICGHYILLAHAAAYHAYQKLPTEISDGGNVGVSVGFDFIYPKDNQSLSDRLAAEIGIDFTFGWIANPLIGTGDYPLSMRLSVNEHSRKEGRIHSRLPYFTPDEILSLKGATDFVGINHYTSWLATFQDPGPNGTQLSSDCDVFTMFDPSWKTTAELDFRFVPAGFSAALRYVRNRYNNPRVIVTENGYAGFANESIQCNPDRELWFKEYIAEMLNAIDEGCNVGGYFAWSLLDDFEVAAGYTIKYGLTHVDFTSLNLTRTVKGIGLLFQNIMKYGLPVPVQN